jgi:hypothetical protein
LDIYLKQGQLSKKLFDDLLPSLQAILGTQCTDKRFIVLQDPVTKEELDDYLKSGYIDEKQYKHCLALVLGREKNEKAKKIIHKKTQTKLNP